MNRTLDAEEKILLAQAAKERAEIVDKYDRGGKGVDIDPWEDPSYEVYHVTDRYGFIHDKRLPEVVSSLEMKAKQTEIERKQKWVKMCSKWETYYGSDKFFKRLYKGLPEAIRGLVWSKILKLNDIKKDNEGVYEDMKQKARRWCNDIRQIDLDVNRTYRNHIMFRKRYDVKQQSLFHVLAAYSMYNTEVGYCQGMSQIAAIMLMYMNEEDAFWALSELLTNDRHSMHGFFIPGFPKLVRFQDHHDQILKKFLPRVKKHLLKHDMCTPLYTIKWFMQCFLDRVPFPLAMRLWDIYIYEGERLLVAMSYNLIKMHKKRILQLDMDHLMSFFQGGLVNDFGYHGDKVIESLIECAEDLRKAKMDLPPPPVDISIEKPTKSFGEFQVPDLDQVIINIRKSEKLESMMEGSDKLKSTDKKNRPSIPPDGGPVLIPSPALRRMTLQRAIEETSSLMDDTLTIDEMSSKASYTDNRESDVESVGTSVAGDIASSLLNLPDNPFFSLAAAASTNAKRQLPTSFQFFNNASNPEVANAAGMLSQTNQPTLQNDTNLNPSSSFAKALFFSMPPAVSRPVASHYFPHKTENIISTDKSKFSSPAVEEQTFSKSVSQSLSDARFSKLEKDLDDAVEELNKNFVELNLNKDTPSNSKTKSRPYSANIPKNHLTTINNFDFSRSKSDLDETSGNQSNTLITANEFASDKTVTPKIKDSLNDNDTADNNSELMHQKDASVISMEDDQPSDNIQSLENDASASDSPAKTPSSENTLSVFFREPITAEINYKDRPSHTTENIDKSVKSAPILSNSVSEGSLKSSKMVPTSNTVRTSKIPMAKSISMKSSLPMKQMNQIKSPQTSASIDLPNPTLATGKIKATTKSSNYSSSNPPRLNRNSIQSADKQTNKLDDTTASKYSPRIGDSNSPKTPLSGTGLLMGNEMLMSQKDASNIKDKEHGSAVINNISNSEVRSKIPLQNTTQQTLYNNNKPSKIPPKPPVRSFKTKLSTLSSNKSSKSEVETVINESKHKLPTIQRKPTKLIPVTVRTQTK